jgi:hypothetical protein
MNQPRATRQEILEYIQANVYIETWQLSYKFGYTKWGAIKKIQSLKRAGLVHNKIVYGKWNLTHQGLRRLDYYLNGQQEKIRKESRTEKLKLEKSFNQGYAQGQAAYGIWVYCKKCHEKIQVLPDSELHKAIINKINNCRHVTCSA